MDRRATSLLLVGLLCLSSVFTGVGIAAYAGKPDDLPPQLEKKIFIHYKRGYGKPDGTPGKGPPPKDEESGHYAFLGKGVKWKTTAILVIDPDGSGLAEDFVRATIIVSAEEWDDGAYSGWGGVTPDLFDGYEVVHDATFDTDQPDERNEILFGDYPKEGVIAVTVIWGYFSGPPGQREIIEFDILFDTDYAWGDADTDTGVMDLQNIATHELGHGAGLDDLYQDAAYQETMYGYAAYGETMKRDLYIGDKEGIKKLYG